MLIVDSFVPMYDHEAGSQRMQHIVEMLRAAGYRVVFLPDNYAPLQPYTDELQQMGVEVLHHVDGGKTQQEALDDVLPLIDLAWISRPDLYRKYAPAIRANGRVRVVYDTVDLSHVRMRRQAELLGEDAGAWREALQVELECARSADVTVVVTGDERRVLEELGLTNVYVIPTIHPMAVARAAALRRVVRFAVHRELPSSAQRRRRRVAVRARDADRLATDSRRDADARRQQSVADRALR